MTRFSRKELEIINIALCLWSATPEGGDVSEEEKDEYDKPAVTARRKVWQRLQRFPGAERESES